MRIYASCGKRIARLYLRAVVYGDMRAVRNEICLYIARFLIGNAYLTALLRILYLDRTRYLGNDSDTLRLTRLEKLLDTGKTLCDIASRNAAGMEGTHRKLGTWLTYGLSRYDTDSLAYLNRLTGSHVRSVALRTYGVLGTAGKDISYLYTLYRIAVGIHTAAQYSVRASGSDHVVCLYDHLSLVVVDRLAREASRDTIPKLLDNGLVIHKRAYIHTGYLSVRTLTAVTLTNDKLLRYIYETPRKISRVRCTKRRIGKSLAGSVRRHKVFQNIKTFTEV